MDAHDIAVTIIALIALAVAIYLLTRRWFWIVGLGLAALASGFACLASVIHFQIFAAVGFFVLAWILYVFASAIAGG